ncbi:hypothetical protein [Mycobacterium asiaticum]|uniref:hypothetical protein n=1 Tax=Mycobacterium asiaticum TaxID=1790 RepID=UPI001C12C537|nr:hypothetical protein [Mycobacterium asiaticum]
MDLGWGRVAIYDRVVDGNAPGEPLPFGPPSTPRRPWFGIAVVAAILISGTLIAAAIFFKGSGESSTPTAGTSGKPATQSDGRSKTCGAWATAKIDFKSTPRLPQGWDYSTPGIDQLIAGRTAMLEKILNVFRSQIAPAPVDVAAAANLFVEKQEAEVRKLPAHTFDAADVYAIDGAYLALDRACGVN